MNIEIKTVEALTIINDIEKTFDYEDCVFAFGYIRKNMEKILANVLYLDEKIVGCAFIQNDKTQSGEDILVILSLEILPKFNGRGFGKRLANYIIHHTDRHIYLDAYWDAFGFWKTVGFQPTEQIDEDEALENVTEMCYTKR